MSLVFGFEINEKPVSFSWNHENGITIVTQNAPQNDTQSDSQKCESRIMGCIWKVSPKKACWLDTQNDTQYAPQNEPQSAPLNALQKHRFRKDKAEIGA